MSRRSGVILLLGLLTLAGCERRDAAPQAEPQAVTAFRHQLSGDVSGEYRPASAGGAVVSLFIGQGAAFDAWEAGRRDAPPLILTLMAPEGEVRVIPQTYVVDDQTVRMSGVTADGEVQLQARIDQGALATARRNLGDRTVVISGVVRIDGQSQTLALTPWSGG